MPRKSPTLLNQVSRGNHRDDHRIPQRGKEVEVRIVPDFRDIPSDLGNIRRHPDRGVDDVLVRPHGVEDHNDEGHHKEDEEDQGHNLKRDPAAVVGFITRHPFDGGSSLFRHYASTSLLLFQVTWITEKIVRTTKKITALAWPCAMLLYLNAVL